MIPSAGQTVRIELHEPAAQSPSLVERSASTPVAFAPDAGASSAPASNKADKPAKGVPVIVPWITGAATIACGAVTLWSALDTKRLHDEYLEHPTDEKWQAGLSRQRMTNIFLASTAVLAATTVTLTFFVRASDTKSVGVRPAIGPTSASVDLTGSF